MTPVKLVICVALLTLFCTHRIVLSVADPLFDFDAIMRDPLDARVLKSSEADGIVTEEIEYSSEGERIFGILAYPKGGSNLPTVFWSQSGMYAAGTYFPHLLAKKGYMCLNVTLPTGPRKAQDAFNTKDPKKANLTLLAIDQMRGITYLTTRPEVDKDRIGVGGSSYGGFFATLIAGADPRVTCGMSYFAAGNHQLGTNLPQFNQLKDPKDREIWQATIDPAWRLKDRAIPFLWCAASNDNWFHLPAVVQTYVDAASDGKRLAIVPQWQHGFPENVDNQLNDWFDIHLTKTRKPYNVCSSISVKSAAGKLQAQWTWTGENACKDAELVVAYGNTAPWHAWVMRYHHRIPATVRERQATAALPLPEVNLPMLVYGNVTDENGVVSSTVPVTIEPVKLGISRPSWSQPPMNCFPSGEFEAFDADFIQRLGWSFGTPDSSVAHAGKQSMRFAAPKDAANAPTHTIQLWHIPDHAHTLRLFLKSERSTKVHARVDGVGRDAPHFNLTADVVPEWKQFEIDCPIDRKELQGYMLSVQPVDPQGGNVWIDSVTFEPLWTP